MEFLNDLLQNQWTVAIGSAIISGIIVYIVTEKLFKHGEQKEKKQNIYNANVDIVAILTRCLVEGDLLKPNVVKSVKKSISRQYKLNERDVFSCEEIRRRTIKQHLENSICFHKAEKRV